jgi:hypothetical protein
MSSAVGAGRVAFDLDSADHRDGIVVAYAAPASHAFAAAIESFVSAVVAAGVDESSA